MASGKLEVMNQLRIKAEELREWMYSHTSPNTSADEFCKVANKYAIICTRIAVIDKQW